MVNVSQTTDIDNNVHVDVLPIELPRRTTHRQHQHSFIDQLFGWGGALSVGLAATPLVLRQLGIGLEHTKLDEGNCCSIIQNAARDNPLLEHKDWNINLDGSRSNTYGIGGWTAGLFSHVPFGEEMFDIEHKLLEHLEVLPFIEEGAADRIDPNVHPLARGGLMNALVAGSVILIGHFGGQAIDHIHRERAVAKAQAEGASDDELARLSSERTLAGRVLQDGSKLLGAGVLVPAVLPGIGHSLMLLSNTAGIDSYGVETDGEGNGSIVGKGPASMLATVLGKNPGICKGATKLTDTMEGTLLSQLCCIAPALTAAIPAMFSHGLQADNISLHLPEGIVPYNPKVHSQEPDKEALAMLSEETLQHRLRNNYYHIDDTLALQEASKGGRNAIKIGSAVASSLAAIAIGDHVIQQQAGDAEQDFNEKAASFKQKRIGAKEHDVSIEGIQKQYRDGNMEPLTAHFVNHDPSTFGSQPDYISFQFGSSCCPGENWFPADKTKELIETAKEAMTGLNTITKNQQLFAGGVASLAGIGGYKLAELIVDKPAERKISILEKENSVIESILESKKASRQTSYSERVLHEKEHEGVKAKKTMAA